MLTVITNVSNNKIIHKRSGRGSANKPELRQQLILENLEKKITDLQIINKSDAISIEWLSQLHNIEYLHFLKHAYSDFLKVCDPDWTDSTESNGLVPNYFCKTKPNSRTPIYKQSGYYGSDNISPIYEDTYENSLIAAQQAYMAAELISSTNSTVYVLAGSPGHHAKVSEYGGYCYINNAVVSAFRLTELGYKRVAILDLDFHASNGCAEMVNNNPILHDKLFVCSIHCDPTVEFPSFEGYVDDYDNSSIINYPLKKATWEEYKIALNHCCESIKKWDIDALVIAFGADTFYDDPDTCPLGRFKLQLDDYNEMGKTIKDHFNELPTIVTQEGGYDLENVPEIVYRFLSSLKED